MKMNVPMKALRTAIAVGSVALLFGCSTTEEKPAAPAAEAAPAAAAKSEMAVMITPKMGKVELSLDGKPYTIMREQNQENTINPAFQKTSRQCPPFCIQPATKAKGVETIGELEVIDYLKKMAAGEKVIVVDNRTPDWFQRGTIPGAVNVPFDKLNRGKGADDVSIAENLERFGAKETGKGWDFSGAKTVVLFCNGMWCGQSPLGIDGLMKEGFPADKIKWYRGGMQDWETVGLTVVKP